MPKGAYRIQQLPGPGPDVRVTSGKDASFAACISSLLVFFFICLIIVLATQPWRIASPGPTSHRGDNNVDKPSHGRYHGNEHNRHISSTAATTLFITTSTETIVPDESEHHESQQHDDDAESIPGGGFTLIDSHQPYVALDTTSTQNDEVTTTQYTSSDVTSSTNEIVSSTLTITTIRTTTTLDPMESVVASKLLDSRQSVHVDSTTEEVPEVDIISPLNNTDQVARLETSAENHENTTSSNSDSTSITVDHSLKSDDELCETGACKTLASRMLSLMNHTVDPCHDFYEFSCGGLRHNRGLLPSDPEQEVEERIRVGMTAIQLKSPLHYHQFMHFYDTCLTYQEDFTYSQRVTKARDELNKAGTFHDRNTWKAEENDLTELLLRLFELHSTPLFDLFLDVSDSGRGSFALRLTPPQHRSALLDVAGIGHKSISDIPPVGCHEESTPDSPARGQKVDLSDAYSNYVECTKNFGPYIDGVKKALTELGAFESYPQENRTALINNAGFFVNTVLDVKKEYLPGAGETRRSLLSKDYKLYTIHELQGNYSLLDWRVLIKGLLNETLPDSTQVQVYFHDYFDELFMELSASDLRSLNNMLLGIHAYELYTGLVAVNPTCDRSKLCLNSARTLMDDVASLLYLASFKPGQIDAFKKHSRDLFTRIKNALEHELNRVEWVNADGGTTKELLLTKLRAMTLELGTERSAFAPERTMPQVPQGGDFFETFIALLRRLRKRMYADYSSAPQAAQQLWSHFSNPTYTSGTALYGLNAVLIPLGAYTTPNFHPDAPHYIHMATLGSLIAHEVAHHFDPVGITFDANGKKGKLQLTEQTKTFYDDNMVRLAKEQFSYARSFRVESGGILQALLDADLSINERLVDQIATYISQLTYTAWHQEDEKRGIQDGHRILPWLGMTWRQAFFVVQAQTYCSKDDILNYWISLFEDEHFPSYLRSNDMVRNSKQFVEAFVCRTGQDMDLGVKIQPFPALDHAEDDYNESPLI